MPQKSRIYYIDCLKGFAIVLVVLGHVFDGYIRAGYFSTYRDIMSGGYNLIYAFHMALFFVVSGFVFHMAYITNEGTAKPSLKKQILNILITYLAFSILFGLFKMFLGKYTNSDVTLTDIFLIWVKPIYPYWYLYILIFYYLVFQLKVIFKIPPVILLLSLTVLSVISNYIPNSIGQYFELRHCLYYCLFFGLGVIIAFHNKLYSKYEGLISIVLLIFAVIAMGIDRVGYTYDDFDDGVLYCNRKWNFLIAAGCSLALLYVFRLAFSNGNHFHVKFLSLLGRHCLEIYVIHCVFTAGNRVVLSKLHIDNFYCNVAINVVTSVLIPIVFAIICKKIKVHKLIFRPVDYMLERKKHNEV